MAAPGDFSNMKYSNELDDAYKAVTIAEAWDWLKNFDDSRGFVFCTDPTMTKIYKNIRYEHSGSSFAWVMREMQFIAKSGWVAYISN